MASDVPSAPDALIDLAHFEAKTSRDGRLLAYARGRIRAFWLRQTLTAFGSITIGLLASAKLGLVLALLGVLGELFDTVLLRRVMARLEQGQVSDAIRRLALVGAGVQGLTIAACVTLAWEALPIYETRFFSACFLICAAINAGLSRPTFRPAADLRLLIFVVTGFALMALDLTERQNVRSDGYAFFAAGFGLLVYMTILLIRMLERTYEQRRRHEAQLIGHQLTQQRAQAELAARSADSQRLALVAKYARDSIVILNPEGSIAWVNDAFTRITGYSFAEAVGNFPADLLNTPGTDPATLARLQHSRDTLTPVRVEILNRTKSGRLVWMETSISPTFDEAGALQLWVAVERDITLAKEREAELARARLAAEEAGQSKSRFLANMSHEIRTPMNGVIGVADLLSETQMTPVQVGYVGTILESGRALLGIINDILDLAKLQSGKSVLEQVPFSPVACIESVMRVLGPEARKRGLDLDFAGDRGEGLVIGDEGKLRQIIMNLVGNAVKFTQGGAVSLRLKLPRSEEDLMEIAVTDTGIGIAPDRIQAIFDSFSQADDGISRQFGGTGLGLTICSMLAHEMGGSIDVQSELGRGSTFTLRAHLLPASGPLELPAPKDRRKFARLRQGLTVMVAEDNRTNMMIVRKMLQTAVPHLIAAENGEEAVRLYRERPPDLILMDVSMPVKDGLQATRDIRALEAEHGLPHCPIVALTANAFGEDREACRVAGFDGFLVKPVSRVDLMAAIAAHFPERQTQTARKIGL